MEELPEACWAPDQECCAICADHHEEVAVPPTGVLVLLSVATVAIYDRGFCLAACVMPISRPASTLLSKDFLTVQDNVSHAHKAPVNGCVVDQCCSSHLMIVCWTGEGAAEADCAASRKGKGAAQSVPEEAPPGCQICEGALLDVDSVWHHSRHSHKHLGAGCSCARYISLSCLVSSAVGFHLTQAFSYQL